MFKGFGKAPGLTHQEKMNIAFNALADLIEDGEINAGEKPNRFHIAQATRKMSHSGKRHEWEVYNVPLRWDVIHAGHPNLVPITATTLGPNEKINIAESASHSVFALYDLTTKILYGGAQFDGVDKDSAIAVHSLGDQVVTPDSSAPEKVQIGLSKLMAFTLYRAMVGVIDPDDTPAIDSLTEELAKHIGIEPKTLATI